MERRCLAMSLQSASLETSRGSSRVAGAAGAGTAGAAAGGSGSCSWCFSGRGVSMTS